MLFKVSLLLNGEKWSYRIIHITANDAHFSPSFQNEICQKRERERERDFLKVYPIISHFKSFHFHYNS